MARKSKVGIPYFSSDTDFFEDPKIKMLISKYGSDGFTAYFKIITTGYKENGYYLSADEDTLLILAGELSLDYEKLIEIIDFMCNKNLFNDMQKRDNKILTSERMQNQYLLGTERREEISFNSKYLLVDPLEAKRKTHKAKIQIDGKCITEINEMYNNEDKMYISGTQSESKSESKVKYIESKEVAEPQKTTFLKSHFETLKALYSKHTKIVDPNEKTHLLPVAEFYSHIPEHLTETDITNCITNAFKNLDKNKGVRVDLLCSNIQAKITAKHEEKLEEIKKPELTQAEIDRRNAEQEKRKADEVWRKQKAKEYREFFEENAELFTEDEKTQFLGHIKKGEMIKAGFIIEPKMEIDDLL